jgi:ABC-type phosphate/phosphonate transport system substrate-binding protein
MPQIVIIESPVDRLIVTSSEQGPKGVQGDPGTSEDDVPYAKRIDAVSSGTDNIYYKGEAVPGTLESAAGWRIRKVVVENDDDVTETWANGTAAFDKIWNDRLSYTFS